MTRRGIVTALAASAIIGTLAIPTVSNLPIPTDFLVQGTTTIAALLGGLSFVGYLIVEALTRWLNFLRHIGRFAIVGLLNTAFDFAVLNLLISLSGITSGVVAVAFKAVAFVVALTNSYFWNKYWTFEYSQPARRHPKRFVSVNLVGFVINIATFWLVVDLVGPLGTFLPVAWANVGVLFGALAVSVWSLVGYKIRGLKLTHK